MSFVINGNLKMVYFQNLIPQQLYQIYYYTKLFPNTQHTHQQPYRSLIPYRQLPGERKRSIDVVTFSNFSIEGATIQRLLSNLQIPNFQLHFQISDITN